MKLTKQLQLMLGQFTATLGGVLTRDRTLLLPDKDGTLATTDINTFTGHYQTFSDRNVAWGITPPPLASRVDKMLWFEPSPLPQPWEWDAPNETWRSASEFFTLTSPTISGINNTAFRVDLPISANYGAKFWAEELWLFNTPRNGVFSASAFWTINFRWYNVAGTGATLYTWSTATHTTQNAIYRVSPTLYQYLGNVFSFSLEGTKTGTPSGVPNLGAVFVGKFAKSA